MMSLRLSLLAVLCTGVLFVAAENSLQGLWYNQLGSKVLLNVQPDGTVTGEYSTAVESEPDAAGDQPSPLKGYLLDEAGNAGAFSVVWKKGSSATSWIVWRNKGDKNDLRTTWLLQSKVKTCGDFWKTTRIHQDYFTRNKQVPAVSRRLPFGFHQARRMVRSVEESTSCSADGKWFDENGSTVSLSFQAEHIQGSLTPKDKLGVLLGSESLKIYGNAGEENLVFGFTAIHGANKSFLAATGQCVKCDNGEEVLHLTYLTTTENNEKNGITAPMFGSMQLRRAP